MVRGTLRPLPMHAVLRGLRVTGSTTTMRTSRTRERKRGIVAVTFEHKYLNAAFDYLDTPGPDAATKRAVDGTGYSVWATPRSAETGGKGCCASIISSRTRTLSGTRDRLIAGVAYWFPHQGTVSTRPAVRRRPGQVRRLRRRSADADARSRCTRW